MKVLLVDDDDHFRSRLARMLMSRGVVTSEANSVSSAKSLIESESYDGYIFDLRMPGDLGMNLVTPVRERSPEAKIIILTGYGSISTVANAFKLGVTDFFSKPVRFEQITAALGLTTPVSAPVEDKIPSLDEVEREYLNRVLSEFGGNVTKAAKALGLHRRSLQRKLA